MGLAGAKQGPSGNVKDVARTCCGRNKNVART